MVQHSTLSGRVVRSVPDVTPVLERIAVEEAGRLRVVTLDVVDDPVAARAYGVMGMPTLGLFVDGELVTRVVGARPHRSVVQALEPFPVPATVR
jgi:thioredoxin 1